MTRSVSTPAPALAIAAATGILSVALAHAQLPVPPDPGPIVVPRTPTLAEDGLEVLQLAESDGSATS